ncbi:MAG: thioredoxin domain-containing protein [Bacteroidota bacterium]
MKQIRFFVLSMLTVVLFSCSSPSSDGSKDAKNDNGQNNPTKEEAAVDVAGTPIHLNDADFLKKVYDYKSNPKLAYVGTKPCIVDFYADWCGPCKIIAPYLVELAAKYKDEIFIYKVNTDNNRDLSQFFNIESIPSVMFCPMSGQPTMMIGANPKDEYEKLINKILLNK